MLRYGPEFSEQFKNIYNPTDEESGALGMMMSEKSQWDEMAVSVTPEVQYMMRNVIKQARRYANGVFEDKYDEVTGDEKTWVPLTESAVDAVVKSIDLDTKDILITPGRPSAIGIAPLIRASILNLFKKIGFGALLNRMTHAVARDGTVVVKSVILKDNVGKKHIRSYIVNLLNFWCDPSAESLQDTAAIERHIYTKAEIDVYADVWENVDKVVYTTRPDRLSDVFNVSGGTTPYTEIWERWGLIPLWWVTGKKKGKDKDELVEGHIVASGVGSPSVVHLIRKNPRKDGRKPYEEGWYRQIDGRWPGRGVPEMLFGLQEYSNEVVNTRRANNRVLQNGIFLIRKGSGITPDMLNAITAGGGLSVTNVNNDIKQLQVQDFRQSSYTDEDRIQLMADRVSGAFDITRGEVGRASASATATLTRDKNIRDTFVLIQENIGFFIERLIRFQYIPLLKEVMKEEDIIKITGDAEVLTFIDEQIINNRKRKFISDRVKGTGFRPEDQELNEFTQKQVAFLKGMGKDRFVKYFREMFDEEVDVDIHVTDEKFNRVVAVQQLRDALLTFSKMEGASKLNVDAVLKEMFNIMGIKSELFMEKPQLLPHAINAGQRPLKEMAQELPNEVTSFENAARLPQQGPTNIPQGGSSISGIPGIGF